MDANRQFQRAPALELTEVTDGFLVHQPDRDRLHFLNPTAAWVLETCDGSLRAGELPELVAAAFQLATPPHEDIDTCLRILLQAGLIVEVERESVEPESRQARCQ